MWVPGTMPQPTSGTVTLARVMVMSTGVVVPRWMTEIVTFVPAGAPDLGAQLVEGHVGRGDAVNRCDQVAGLDSARRRRAIRR